MQQLLIIGAGGHGVTVADAAEQSGAWSKIAFLDDSYPERKEVAGWQVLGGTDDLDKVKGQFDAAIVAIGDCASRLALLNVIDRAQVAIASVKHPSACVSKLAEVRGGTVLLANAVVNARAVVESGCILNTAATVDHDCHLSEGVHIAPGAHLAANVSVGARSWIGIGASVRQQVRIGSDVVVGAGASVINDIDDGNTVVGVPARRIK